MKNVKLFDLLDQTPTKDKIFKRHRQRKKIETENKQTLAQKTEIQIKHWSIETTKET